MKQVIPVLISQYELLQWRGNTFMFVWCVLLYFITIKLIMKYLVTELPTTRKKHRIGDDIKLLYVKNKSLTQNQICICS